MGNHSHSFSFSLQDEVNGEPLTPLNVDIQTLHQYMGEVITLIQGDHSKVEFSNEPIQIIKGSIVLKTTLSSVMATTLLSDIHVLQQSKDLDSISPKRAEVVAKWQKKAKAPNSKRRFTLFSDHEEFKLIEPFKIHANSEFEHREKDLWVSSEKYLTGEVFDAGGKTKPNIHLILKDGSDVKISATRSQLRGNKYLYEQMTFNVTAKEHLKTGELKDIILIEAIATSRKIDEEKLKALWAKGKEAWKDVKSPAQWVESMRSA